MSLLVANPDVRRLQTQLRSLAFAPYQIKTAELGGGQDAPFEVAFSNLAHAYIKDKAPKLLDFEVGFQLIEKNAENTKAVGIFGFKVGNQWLYAPVFFLNGDLKGHELLYIKSQDAFVPMKENWVNYILGKKPGILGEGVERNLSHLGVLNPNLSQLSRSPHKFASHTPRMAAWARDFLPDLGYLVTTPLEKQAKFAEMKGVPELLAEAGPASFRDLLTKLASYPGIVAAVDRLYGEDFLPGLATLHRKAVEKRAWSRKSLLAEKQATYPGCGSHTRKRKMKKKASLMDGLEKGSFFGFGGPKIPAHLTRYHDYDAELSPDQAPLDQPHLPVSDHYEQEGYHYAHDRAGRRFRLKKPLPDFDNSAYVVGHDVDPKGGKIFSVTDPDRKKQLQEEIQRIYADRLLEMRAHGYGAKTAADPRSNVRVYREEEINANPDLILDLNDDERRRLLKARVVVRDKRSDGQVSAAYNVQTQFKVNNPDESGLWEVLHKPDVFKRVLMIKGPYAANGRQEYATIVTADGDGKPWCNVHPGHLWARSNYSGQAFREWLEKLPDASGLSESKEQVYVLIGPNGEGTVPFMVEGGFDDDGPTKIFNVKYMAGCTYTFPGGLPDHSYRARRDPSNIFMEGERLVLTGRPGRKIVVRNGELYVPDGFKMLTIEALGDDAKKRVEELQGKKPEDATTRKTKDQMPPPRLLDSKDGKPTERSADQQEFATRPHRGKTPLFVPGTVGDLQLLLVTHTLPLKIHSDGKDVTVNDELKLDKESAWVHLLVNHHFREKVAKYLVGEALRKGTVEVRVKYAADPAEDMIRGAPGAPGFPEPPRGADNFMGEGFQTQGIQEDEIKVPDMSASKTDRSIYNPTGPDPRSMQVAQNAAQTGQREVFDTAMLGSLLNTVREDSIVERYMGDLMKGLDRLGRILFQFYWHGEEFEDRYGKQDMPEMEDSLRNAFEGVGDIVLALKRKTVDPYHDETTDVDLGALANQ